jgi:hypothetical protein
MGIRSWNIRRRGLEYPLKNESAHKNLTIKSVTQIKKKMNLLNSELRCSHRRNKKHVAKEIKNPLDANWSAH